MLHKDYTSFIRGAKRMSCHTFFNHNKNERTLNTTECLKVAFNGLKTTQCECDIQ